MSKENSFFRQIIIEIIAIFIGISLALIIDAEKDKHNSIQEVKNHFSLIINEFKKDSLELNTLETITTLQVKSINNIRQSLNVNDEKTFNDEIKSFGSTKIYYPRIDEINLILNSSSFSHIYNKTIFSRLNDLKSDSKNFNLIQEYELELIKDLKTKLIFPNKDYSSQQINLSKMTNKDYFLNQLAEYQNILETKKMLIGSISSGMEICKNEIIKMISEY